MNYKKIHLYIIVFMILCLVYLYFTGCENPASTENVNDPHYIIVEIETKDGLGRAYQCDEVYFTVFQEQGLILLKEGEVIYWTNADNISNYKIKVQ